MEKKQGSSDRVRISQAVFDGLEFIRRLGVTNMFDRPTVLQLARDWDYDETADWLETVDNGTYGRVILLGPEIIGSESLDETLDRLDREYDEERRGFWEGDEPSPATPVEDDSSPQGTTPEQLTTQSTLVELGKRAATTLAATYDTEEMGVLFGPALERITVERIALMRNLAEASHLGIQLDETVTEIERGITSLQDLIDPENY